MNRRVRRIAVPALSTAMLLAFGPAASSAVHSAGTATASGCGGTAYAPPGTIYGPVSQTTTGVAGYPGFREGYSFKVEGNVPTPVAVQAKGYDANNQEQWYGLGAAGDQGGGVVPWGNNLASPAIRATSASVNGVFVSWSC